MRRCLLYSIAIALLIVLSLAVTGFAGSRPTITYMRTCTSVIERARQLFEASGWTASFSAGDTIYCVAKVDIPSHASRRSYEATISWYAPNGELYYEHDYDDLKKGYVWSLWSSIAAVSLTGEWRVVFSVRYGGRKSLVFTVGTVAYEDDLALPSFNPPDFNSSPPSLDLPDFSLPDLDLGLDSPVLPVTEPTPQPVSGREDEPNETGEMANLLKLGERVQGEVRFYSTEIYDQDWFCVDLVSSKGYWLALNAVGTTSHWLSPNSFLRLYKGDWLSDPLSYSSYLRQEQNENRSTCDVVISLREPAKYYILITARDCEHDVVYSLQVTTVKPEWAEE